MGVNLWCRDTQIGKVAINGDNDCVSIEFNDEAREEQGGRVHREITGEWRPWCTIMWVRYMRGKHR